MTGTSLPSSSVDLGTINDIDYCAGGVAFYGKGCPGANSRIPEMVFGGLPYQGNTSFAAGRRAIGTRAPRNPSSGRRR